MGLPVIGAHLLNVSNVHNQESTNADIDKYKDSSHIKPHPDKKKQITLTLKTLFYKTTNISLNQLVHALTFLFSIFVFSPLKCKTI